MAITNFIPTIWSENLTRALDQEYVGVAHCNRDYEGEIKNCGSTVKICGVGSVDIFDYTKNADMSMPQDLSDTVTELTIDQAKYFNFQIDDIDRAQSSPKLMDAAMKVAAQGLAQDADRFIFKLSEEATHNVYVSEPNNVEEAMQALFAAREKLFKAGVTDSSDVVFEVSPGVASLLLKAKITNCSDTNEIYEKGTLGSIFGCPIYVSNNIHIDDTSSIFDHHKCLLRTRRSVAFAEQLSEIEAYRPEKRFADAVKGLHLYGAKIVYPNEFIVVNFSMEKDA